MKRKIKIPETIRCVSLLFLLFWLLFYLICCKFENYVFALCYGMIWISQNGKRMSFLFIVFDCWLETRRAEENVWIKYMHRAHDRKYRDIQLWNPFKFKLGGNEFRLLKWMSSKWNDKARRFSKWKLKQKREERKQHKFIVIESNEWCEMWNVWADVDSIPL